MTKPTKPTPAAEDMFVIPQYSLDKLGMDAMPAFPPDFRPAETLEEARGPGHDRPVLISQPPRF